MKKDYIHQQFEPAYKALKNLEERTEKELIQQAKAWAKILGRRKKDGKNSNRSD